MIVFPNAKINIGLNIVSKREDGYHNIETIFYPVKKWNDALEVITSPNGVDQFTTSGLQIDGDPNYNLCIKALACMRMQLNIPPLQMHLHKVIPFGAGLGGGSSDAAYMLKLLNKQYHPNYTDEELEEMATTIGADCPVFIKNRPVMAQGIGNLFSEINIQLKGLWLLIVAPGIHVPTAEAYGGINPGKPSVALSEAINRPIEEWKNCIKNDFEDVIFPRHPQLEKIKTQLYDKGAIYASMSGSGSAIYGIFTEKPECKWQDEFKIHFELLD